MLATVILYFCCIVHFSSTCIFIFGYILVYLILVTGPPVDSGPAAHGGGGGSIFYNGLCGETTPEGCTFFRLQVYERGEISPFEVYERGGKSVMSVCKRRNRAKSS